MSRVASKASPMTRCALSHVSRLLHRARTLMCARLSHLHLDRAHPVPHMRVAATHRYAEAHGLLGFLQVADATWAVRLVQHGISTCVALSKRAAAAADAPKDADAHMQLELPKHYYNVSQTGGMLHQTIAKHVATHKQHGRAQACCTARPQPPAPALLFARDRLSPFSSGNAAR